MNAEGENVNIVGICQVRNEDVFLNQALINIHDFCDMIIVADHQSHDDTERIVRQRMRVSSKIKYHSITHPSKAHDLIRGYANTKTWIFPVDGDELYDPVGLAKLKSQIINGEFNAYRQIYGHSLHCVSIDQKKKLAKGYMSPPSRTVTKFYNFGALIDWSGPCSERCHGGNIVFKYGYSKDSNLNMQDTISWDESPFRLLHTCFMRRSSLDHDNINTIRLNPFEIHAMFRPPRWLYHLRQLLKLPTVSKYKQERYMRGNLTEFEISSFFKNP
jgi:glycosyltransferase involved in cell wall biosynthesis